MTHDSTFSDYEEAEKYVFETEQSQIVRFVENGYISIVYLRYMYHEIIGAFVIPEPVNSLMLKDMPAA